MASNVLGIVNNSSTRDNAALIYCHGLEKELSLKNRRRYQDIFIGKCYLYVLLKQLIDS